MKRLAIKIAAAAVAGFLSITSAWADRDHHWHVHDGWRDRDWGHHHHHGGWGHEHHRGWNHGPRWGWGGWGQPPRVIIERHYRPPVTYRDYYDGYAPPPPPPPVYYREVPPYYDRQGYRSSISEAVPIIAGGVIGGMVGDQVGGGQSAAAITGSVLGSVLGHEIVGR